MQPNDTNRLDTAQLAKLSPEQVAAFAARCSRDAANGEHAAYVTREAVLDLWQQFRGLDNRAQAISDLVGIEVASRRRQGA